MNFIAELKRRNVIRMAGLYLVGAWLVIQVSSTVLPMFNSPAWLPRSIVLLLAVGFVPMLVFSWVFELTPDGIKRDDHVRPEESIAPQTARWMDRAIIVVLAIAILYFGFDKFVLAPRREARELSAATQLGRNEAQAASNDKSIAVLPFVDMSEKHDQEYFSDGIAEELLNRLAQFPDLKVAARTSAFQFKGMNLDIADIGRKLKVSHVLEGSVRKEGGLLRITAQLIDSSSGFHLWSETYERGAADVFQVQDEISTAIANALEAKISGRLIDAHAARQAKPEAYDDYLQGRALVAKRVGDNCRLAVEAFDRAIAKDPAYSPAHSGRAFALTIGSYWGDWLPRRQAFAEARASIDEALRLDPDNAEAYMVRGIIGTTSLRIVEGKADFDRALALAPGSVDVINFYGDMQEFTGDMRGAERMKRKAITLDPLAFIHPVNLSQILASQGRMTESLQYAQRGDALGVAVGGRSIKGVVFAAQLRVGRTADAQRTFDDYCAAPPPDEVQRCHAMHIALLAASGRTAQAKREMAGILADVHANKSWVLNGMSGSVGLAAVYVLYLHDPHGAAQEIRASLDDVQWFGYNYLLGSLQGQNLPEEISTDSDWLAAWNDPRLKEFMAAYRANLTRFRSGG